MKSFVRILQKCFGYNVNSPNTLKDNMNMLLDLPPILKLSNFRDSFIKPLVMDYSLGIATFQLLNELCSNSEKIITKEDLFNLVLSYIDSSVTKLDCEVIIYFLENNCCLQKYCFESINYNYKGVPI
jgi:hypothetical protein